MGVDASSLDLEETDAVERGSSTRIRAVRGHAGAESATELVNSTGSPATLLLAPCAAELKLLARRLAFGRSSAFLSSWLAACESSALLTQESSDYREPLARASAPLIESLANARIDLAELHAMELFTDLRALTLSVSSVLDLIAAFEHAVAEHAPNAEWQAVAQTLGRFLTCTAVATFSHAPPTHAFSESSERVRNPAARRPDLRQTGRQDPAPATRLVGESAKLRELRAQLADIAGAPGAVLIVGESGTGKELVAEAIHGLGPFREQPFVAVNCAALPRELIESELFGHERGAFTGSREASSGLLRAAGRGTAFLDEITEMPEALQPKLLRALEQRAVRPVGGLREVAICARIVAATNADPERRTEHSGLRSDLFYRLCVHRVEVPPLRERVDDIPILVAHFLADLARSGHRVPSGFSSASLLLLACHAWPGNVRELRNVVEHSCATAKTGLVEPRHLPQRLFGSGAAAATTPPANEESLALKLVERRHIEHVLGLAGGNKARAARLLGLSRHQLYLKLERLELGDDRE